MSIWADTSEGPAEEVGRHLAELALRDAHRAGAQLPDQRRRADGETGRRGAARTRRAQSATGAWRPPSGLTSDAAQGILILSGGTDGEDGPTDAAGAFVDGAMIADARQLRLDAADYLRRNDAYHWFDPLDGLIKTGPTDTNVCDVRVVLVDRVELTARTG